MAGLVRCHDGKPCPGCNETVGYEHAYMFNALNRLDRHENKIMEHLVNLHDYPGPLPAPVVPHPAMDAYIDLHKRLLEICQLIVLDGSVIRWSPGTWACLIRLGPVWKQTLHEIGEITDAHNEDSRHARGEQNVLKEARGSKHDHWGLRPDTSYDYYVREPILEPDIVCTACGREYEIADHFKNRLIKDPTWYGKFRCAGCGHREVPWSVIQVVSLELRGERDVGGVGW